MLIWLHGTIFVAALLLKAGVAAVICLVSLQLPLSPTAQLLNSSSHGQDEWPVGMVDDVQDTPAGCEKGLEAIKLVCFTNAEHNGKTVRHVPLHKPPPSHLQVEIIGATTDDASHV
jgi:hypothetical protein